MDDKDTYEKMRDSYNRNLDMENEQVNFAYESINKILILVSTGAFVVSISFITWAKNSVSAPYLLIISWSAFAFAIYYQIKDLQLTREIAMKKAHWLNVSAKSGFLQNWESLTNEDPEIKNMIAKGQFCERLMRVLVVVGMALLIVFGAANLLAQNNQKEKDEDFTKGYGLIQVEEFRRWQKN